jgi:hypothetical protein
MNRRMTVILLLLLCGGAAFAQAPDQTGKPATPTSTAAATTPENEIVIAPQTVDNDTESTKFSEYRDFQDGVFVDRLRYNATLGNTSLRLLGRHGGRDDQQFDLGIGDDASWRATLTWETASTASPG